MALSSRREVWVRSVAERGGGLVVFCAGASGGGFGDVEGFADAAAEDLAYHDCAEQEDYF